MEAIFGMHNWPGMAVGSSRCARAGDGVEQRVQDHHPRQGQPRRLPHNGIDPVPVACQMVQAFQTIITRNKKPIDAGVISVTMIHAGEATNVIPDSCELQGTVRTFTLEVLDLIEQRMREIAEHTCAAFDASCEFELPPQLPAHHQFRAETEFARQVMARWWAPTTWSPFEPTMGAEDFSYFLLQAKPGCYFLHRQRRRQPPRDGPRLGPCMLHNPSYDFNDDLIPLGATAWVRLAEKWLAQENVDLNRNFHDFSQAAAGQRRLPRTGAPAAAGALAARRRTCRRHRRLHRRAACAPSRPRSRSGQHDPEGLFFGGRARPGATRRCARCCAARHAVLQRLAWIDLHTGLGPSGLGERIFAGARRRRHAGSARAPGGAAR
jgi:hypothetical protein